MLKICFFEGTNVKIKHLEKNGRFSIDHVEIIHEHCISFLFFLELQRDQLDIDLEDINM